VFAGEVVDWCYWNYAEVGEALRRRTGGGAAVAFSMAVIRPAEASWVGWRWGIGVADVLEVGSLLDGWKTAKHV
jgi:hypothetical protein